jgi:hypothetical protein
MLKSTEICMSVITARPDDGTGIDGSVGVVCGLLWVDPGFKSRKGKENFLHQNARASRSYSWG